MSEREEREPRDIVPKLGDDIPEDWLKKATQEIQTQYRPVMLNNFRGKENVEVFIHHPSTEEEGIASGAYSRTFNDEFKKNELMTLKEMEKSLAERGIWGEAEEDKLKILREEIHDIEFASAKLRKKGNPSKKILNTLRANWKAKRKEINQILAEKQSYLDHTVEGKADSIEMQTRLSLCVRYPDGKRVWNSFEELQAEDSRSAVLTLMHEAMFFWAGLTQEIISELPANVLFGREENQKIS